MTAYLEHHVLVIGAAIVVACFVVAISVSRSFIYLSFGLLRW